MMHRVYCFLPVRLFHGNQDDRIESRTGMAMERHTERVVMASSGSQSFDGSAGVVHLRTRNADAAIHFLKLGMNAKEIARVSGPDGRSVLHCELQVGMTLVMVCDEMIAWGDDPKGTRHVSQAPMACRVMVPNVDDLLAQCMEQGAELITPPSNAFWGERFARLRDPFDNEWILAQLIEPMSPEEQAEHARQALGGNRRTDGPHA